MTATINESCTVVELGSTAPAEAFATRLRVAEVLREVSQRFVDLPAAEIETGVDGALRAVVVALGFDRGVVAHFSPDKQHFFLSHRYPASGQRVAFALGEPIPTSKLPTTTGCILAGEELIVASEMDLPEPERELYRQLGLKSSAVLPMRIGGEVTGAVAFLGRRAESLSDRDSLRIVAQLFASAFDRKHTDAALERRLRLAELIGDLSRRFVDLRAAEIERGIEGALQLVVDTLELSLGEVGEFATNHQHFVVTHRYARQDEPSVFELGRHVPTSTLPFLTECIQNGREFVFDDPNDIPEGATTERQLARRHELRAGVVFPLLIGREVIGFVSFRSRTALGPALESLRVVAQLFAGALDRKRSDDVLQRRLRFAELISEVSRCFIELTSTELDAAFEQTLKRIAELSGFKNALIYRLSDDKKRFSITHRHTAPGIEPDTPLSVEHPVAPFGYVLKRLTLKKPILLTPETLPLDAVAEREALALRGGRHEIMLPLVVGGEVLGAVEFESEPPLPDQQLLDALEVIGELFASTIDRHRQGILIEERLRFEQALSNMSARFIATPESFESIIDDALQATAEALEFDRVALFELTKERSYFQLTHEWCADGIPSFAGSASGLPIDTFGWPLTELRNGRAMVFGPEDIPPEGVNARAVLARDATRLMAIVPLIVGGEVTGCIGYFRIRVDRRLAPGQLRRLQLVGEMIASALARTTALASLQRAEARFASVIASALDGFAIVNEAGVILEWTAQADRILGWRRGEMLGTPLANIVLYENVSQPGSLTPAQLYKRAQQLAAKRLEVQGRHRDGYDLPIELSISQLDGADAKVYAMFIRDITDRKRAEQVRQQAFDEVSRLKLQIEGERDYLREEIRSERQLGDFVGKSSGLGKVLDLVDSVATTSATVLIRGESGVGKELVARAIHTRSRRADGPLVKVNCASIPKELFESEFFGHVRGAFTGALKNRVGRFELADHGTLFLDEVGEIPLELQAKLLRVLQESELERVGDDRTRKVDVRVVAATNRDLEVEAAEGRFRKDLFYRLSVFPIEIPPLRERREDVVPLAQHFLRTSSRNLGRQGLSLDDEQQRQLAAYDWPGNVRELQHVLERAVILSPVPPLRLDLALPREAPATAGAVSGRVLKDEQLRALERENLRSALEQANWQVSGPGGAAELLGINPSTLRDRMRAFELQRPKPS